MRKTVFAPEILALISGLRRDPLFYFLLLLGVFLAFAVVGITSSLFALLCFTFCATALAVIDLRYFLLPDILVFLLFISGLTISTSLLGLPWQASLAGAIVGGVFFALVRGLMTYVLKQEALGLGDVKLLAALGAWVGLVNLPPLLLVACLLALPFSLLQRLKTPNAPQIPFGPALLAAAFSVLLYPNACWQLFWRLRQSIHSLLQGIYS